MENDPFIQLDGKTLKNKLGIISNPDSLQLAEREYSIEREETVHEDVDGQFNADHLRAIHKHLFQDVYSWAGRMRHDSFEMDGEFIGPGNCVEFLSKGDTEFLATYKLEAGLDKVTGLAAADSLFSNKISRFADGAAKVFAELNFVHPFREGNGRTQRAFMEQLARRAGHHLDFRGVTVERNIGASIEAEKGSLESLRRILFESLDPVKVALRCKAIGYLGKAGAPVDNFWIELATCNDPVQGTIWNQTPEHDCVLNWENRFLILPSGSLPSHLEEGDIVDFVFTASYGDVSLPEQENSPHELKVRAKSDSTYTANAFQDFVRTGDNMNGTYSYENQLQMIDMAIGQLNHLKAYLEATRTAYKGHVNEAENAGMEAAHIRGLRDREKQLEQTIDSVSYILSHHISRFDNVHRAEIEMLLHSAGE